MGKRIFVILLLALLSLFVLINVYSSQVLHPLFFNLVNNQKKSDAVLFLKKIKGTQKFPQQLQYFKNIYGQDIEKEVFAEEIKRKQEIIKFETLLQKNAKARDVLIKLAILYFEDGDLNKAKEYYQRAKNIDPMVKIEELEVTLPIDKYNFK